MEPPPTTVPTAKQVGDALGLRAWAEPSVWTARMLAALEQGVKGGVWFSLISRHGADEERWPVAYFAEQGLFSLKAAHAKLVSPL
jgi:hypothetical protein